MIVQACGHTISRCSTTGRVSMIVSATGTAYSKKGKINAIIRVIKRVIFKITDFIRKYIPQLRKYMFRSGEPNNMAPPAVKLFNLKQ